MKMWLIGREPEIIMNILHQTQSKNSIEGEAYPSYCIIMGHGWLQQVLAGRDFKELRF